MKKTIRMGDLRDVDGVADHLRDIVEWKNLLIEGGYHHEPIDAEKMLTWLRTYGKPLLPYICNTSEYLSKAADEGKKILFEAQLGALRDIDYGIYPYTSSSNSIAAFSTIGAGIPQLHLDESIGVMKAYSTCVGEVRSCASCSVKRAKSFAGRATNMARLPADREESAASMSWPRATERVSGRDRNRADKA